MGSYRETHVYMSVCTPERLDPRWRQKKTEIVLSQERRNDAYMEREAEREISTGDYVDAAHSCTLESS